MSSNHSFTTYFIEVEIEIGCCAASSLSVPDLANGHRILAVDRRGGDIAVMRFMVVWLAPGSNGSARIRTRIRVVARLLQDSC